MTTTRFRMNLGGARLAPAASYPGDFNPHLRTIGRAIQAAAGAIEGQSLKADGLHGPLNAAQARSVLELLSLCYARQIYSSSTAVLICRNIQHPQFDCIDFLNVDFLRRFRAENRDAIHCCLTAALYYLAAQNLIAGLVTKIDAAQIAVDANRRIVTAMFIDSMELDGEQGPRGTA